MDNKQLEFDFRERRKPKPPEISVWVKKENSMRYLSASLRAEVKEIAERIYKELGVPSWMINN